MQRRGEIGTGFIPAADRVRRYGKTDGERVTQLLPSAAHSTHPGVTVSQPATTRLLLLPAGCPRGNKLPGKDMQHTESTTHARGHRPPKLQRVKALTHGATALMFLGPNHWRRAPETQPALAHARYLRHGNARGRSRRRCGFPAAVHRPNAAGWKRRWEGGTRPGRGGPSRAEGGRGAGRGKEGGSSGAAVCRRSALSSGSGRGGGEGEGLCEACLSGRVRAAAAGGRERRFLPEGPGEGGCGIRVAQGAPCARRGGRSVW